jgi:hypothetical protein
MKTVLTAAALLIAESVGSTASADNIIGVSGGFPVAVFADADPSDFVVALDQAGTCGSAFFHIQRSNPNFKEVVAVLLTAFSTGQYLQLYVASCSASGNRNILSHVGLCKVHCP